MATATYSSRDMTYRGENYDVFDSTLIPSTRMGQYRRFMNHQYAFPPRPATNGKSAYTWANTTFSETFRA